MSRERVLLGFDTGNEQHARVLRMLNSAASGSRSKYAIQLIAQALDMEETVYRGVKRALSEYRPQIQPQQADRGHIPTDMLDFMSSL